MVDLIEMAVELFIEGFFDVLRISHGRSVCTDDGCIWVLSYLDAQGHETVIDDSRQAIELSCDGRANGKANSRGPDIFRFPDAIKGVASSNFLKLGLTRDSGLGQGCYVDLVTAKHPSDESCVAHWSVASVKHGADIPCSKN